MGVEWVVLLKTLGQWDCGRGDSHPVVDMGFLEGGWGASPARKKDKGTAFQETVSWLSGQAWKLEPEVLGDTESDTWVPGLALQPLAE